MSSPEVTLWVCPDCGMKSNDDFKWHERPDGEVCPGVPVPVLYAPKGEGQSATPLAAPGLLEAVVQAAVAWVKENDWVCLGEIEKALIEAVRALLAGKEAQHG